MIKTLFIRTIPLIITILLSSCLRSPDFNNPLEKEALRLEAGNYIVKLNIQGMLPGNTLGLQLNNSEMISVQGNGSYSFHSILKEGNNYNITIFSPSYRQNCTIDPASGVVGKTDVQVTVTCVTVLFLVGGSVNTYAGPNYSIQLQINGGEYLFVSQGQNFWFNGTLLNNGDPYNVVVTVQPPGGLCNVVNGSGTINGEDVNNVQIQCIPWGYDFISITPTPNTIAGKNQPIVLVANKSLDPGNCVITSVLNGSMISNNPANASFAFSTTHQTNDTLTISPTSVWQTGTGQFLYLSGCLAVGGEPYIYSNLSIYYTVVNDPNRIRYVTPTGSNANNGLTPATAQQSIQYAYNQLVSSYSTECAIDKDCYVLLTSGNYPVNSPIPIQSGISILGAFNSNFTDRQPWNDSQRSVINGSGISLVSCGAISASVPCATLVASPPLANPEPQLSGVKVIGPNVTHTTAMRLNGTLPQITDCFFQGGNCNSANCTSSGMYITSTGYSSIILAYLTFRGGDCTGNNCTTSGMVYDANSPMLSIGNSSFLGGNSNSLGSISNGILISTNAQNTIKLFNSGAAAGAAHFTSGLQLLSDQVINLQVQNSDISGGAGNSNHVGILVGNSPASSSITIENSIIYGGGLGPSANPSTGSAAFVIENSNFNYTISHSLLFAGEAGSSGNSSVIYINTTLTNPLNIFYNNLIGGAGLYRYGINFAASSWITGSDISYNNFFNTPTAFVATSAPPTLFTVIQPTSLATADLSTTVPAPNNLNVAPHFANPNANPPDFRYTSSSPCALTQAPDVAKSGVFIFNMDKDYMARPGSNSTRSIGPYEWDGACVP